MSVPRNRLSAPPRPQAGAAHRNPVLKPLVALAVLFGGTLPIAYFAFLAAGEPMALGIVLSANLAYASCFTAFMLWNSVAELRRAHHSPARHSELPGITVAVPAYNERHTIVACLQSLLGQTVPIDDIIVVDDGSDDGSFDMLRLWLRLEPTLPAAALDGSVEIHASARHSNIRLLRQPRGGKARALNRALAQATGSVFVTVDADCTVNSEAVARLVAPLSADPQVLAAGGIVKPGNGVAREDETARDPDPPTALLPRLQWVEYATGFVWRFGWAHIESQLLLSGSFCCLRTKALRACGGFAEDSLTEDYEISYRLHRDALSRNLPYRMITVPDALALTLVPETVGSFLQQRTRWFQGFLETLWAYRGCILRARYGWFGIFALSAKVIDAVSPLLAAIAIVSVASALISGGAPWLVPVLALLGARWVLEFAISLCLLWLHHRYVQTGLGAGSKRTLYWLGPVNFAFQALAWYVYGVRAFANIFMGRSSWLKAVHSGLGQSPEKPS
jgi:cellulose synthase/poly-beta-1,6-N-acetylglucosamine synthase-like glycosyltransferase